MRNEAKLRWKHGTNSRGHEDGQFCCGQSQALIVGTCWFINLDKCARVPGEVRESCWSEKSWYLTAEEHFECSSWGKVWQLELLHFKFFFLKKKGKKERKSNNKLFILIRKMRTTEIWKDSLRSIKSIWLDLVSNFPAQDFPMCFQSPLFKRSNFRTCWTSCSSYWLHRETRFWKPKCFVRDRRARTETAVIGWGKAVVYQKSAALRGEKGIQQLSLNEEHWNFAVRNQKALWRSGWHVWQPQSWIPRRAGKGGLQLEIHELQKIHFVKAEVLFTSYFGP